MLYKEAVDSLTNFIVRVAHFEGRLINYEILEKKVDVCRLKQITTIKAYDPNWKLKNFIESYPKYFWMYRSSDNIVYVAVAIYYYFMNPRFCHALADVRDDRLMECITPHISGLRNGKVGEHSQKAFIYEYAKSTLCVYDVLSAIRDCKTETTKNTGFFFADVMTKYLTFTPSTHTALQYQSEKTEPRLIVKDFLKRFGKIFMCNNRSVFYTVDRLEPLIGAFELDLIWSYALECVVKDMNCYIDLENELYAFINKYRLRFPRITYPLLNTIFGTHPEFCFLPGDNTVWLLITCEMSHDKLRSLVNLFEDQLCHSPIPFIHYTECKNVVLKYRPELLEGCDETCITIAATLYNKPKQFTFRNGNIHLTSEYREKLIPTVSPIMAPVKPIINNWVVLHHPEFVDGFVVEVSVETAIIRFQPKLIVITDIKKPMEDYLHNTHAFCCINITCLNIFQIDDFNTIMKVGDRVNCSFGCERAPYLDYPYYNIVTRIYAITDPLTNICRISTEEFIDIPPPRRGPKTPPLPTVSLDMPGPSTSVAGPSAPMPGPSTPVAGPSTPMAGINEEFIFQFNQEYLDSRYNFYIPFQNPDANLIKTLTSEATELKKPKKRRIAEMSGSQEDSETEHTPSARKIKKVSEKRKKTQSALLPTAEDKIDSNDPK